MTGSLLNLRDNGKKILVYASGVAAAFIAGGILLSIFGINPAATYAAILSKAFGSTTGLRQTLITSAPILLAAAGIELAKRAGVMNLGAEGQIIAGAVGAQLAALACGDLPPVLAVVIVLLSGIAAGMLWILIPAILKVNFGVNEIVVLIMTNQIASYILGWLVRGPLKDPQSSNNQGALIPEAAWLPQLPLPVKLHAGIIIAVAVMLLTYWIYNRTTLGYRLKVVGKSKRSAEYAGISVKKVMFGAMAVSGALAGLAGAIQVAGVHHRVTGSISNGFGWTGLMVAMLVGRNPVLLLIVTLLYSALSAGNLIIQVTDKVPAQLADIIQAIIVLFVVGAQSIYDLAEKRRKHG